MFLKKVRKEMIVLSSQMRKSPKPTVHTETWMTKIDENKRVQELKFFRGLERSFTAGKCLVLYI